MQQGQSSSYKSADFLPTKWPEILISKPQQGWSKDRPSLGSMAGFPWSMQLHNQRYLQHASLVQHIGSNAMTQQRADSLAAAWKVDRASEQQHSHTQQRRMGN